MSDSDDNSSYASDSFHLEGSNDKESSPSKRSVTAATAPCWWQDQLARAAAPAATSASLARAPAPPAWHAQCSPTHARQQARPSLHQASLQHHQQQATAQLQHTVAPACMMTRAKCAAAVELPTHSGRCETRQTQKPTQLARLTTHTRFVFVPTTATTLKSQLWSLCMARTGNMCCRFLQQSSLRQVLRLPWMPVLPASLQSALPLEHRPHHHPYRLCRLARHDSNNLLRRQASSPLTSLLPPRCSAAQAAPPGALTLALGDAGPVQPRRASFRPSVQSLAVSP